MPNVRASSGTIGTTRSPNPSASMSRRRSRTIAVVVATGWSVPTRNSSTADRGGAARGLRSGRGGRQGREAVLGVLVGDGDPEPVPQLEEPLGREPLDLVGAVAALDRVTEAPPLARLREDHGRPVLLRDRGRVRRVHL